MSLKFNASKIFDKNMKNTFSGDVITYVHQHGDMGYIEAVTFVCEKYEIEPEHCVKFLSKPLIEKIKVEAVDLNMAKAEHTGRLPV